MKQVRELDVAEVHRREEVPEGVADGATGRRLVGCAADTS